MLVWHLSWITSLLSMPVETPPNWCTGEREECMCVCACCVHACVWVRGCVRACVRVCVWVCGWVGGWVGGCAMDVWVWQVGVSQPI